MGYVERHLLPGERVLYKTRLHWGVFIKPALIVLAGVVLMVLLRPVQDPRVALDGRRGGHADRARCGASSTTSR